MSSGIYKIENKINHKIYVGRSIDIEQRWQHHIWESNNSNLPQYNYTIHRALRKYGFNNFTFSIIEECSENLLNEKEKYWIQYYDSYQNGYNETLGGDTGPSLPGELNPNTQLTNNEVIQIRQDVLDGILPKEGYKKYQNKISYQTFCNIRRGCRLREYWSRYQRIYSFSRIYISSTS